MRRVVLAGALAVPIVALSCTSSPPITPAPGPANLLALHGEWVGTYEADVAHGRSGALLFRLDATEEVAQGCGLLRVKGRETAEGIPWEGDIWAHVPPERLILTTFVRGADGTVDGNFATFADPVCGCQVTMSFNGVVRGNVMEGTYVLEHVSGAEQTTGKWRVARRAAG